TDLSAPRLPEIPAMPPPPMMPGEAFATLLHGPGASSAGLRAIGAAWRGTAGALRNVGEQVLVNARAAAEQWHDDGRQRAAANVGAPAQRLHRRAEDAEELAAAAESNAEQFDQALTRTPVPAQFERLRYDIARLAAANTRGQYTAAIMAKQRDYA